MVIRRQTTQNTDVRSENPVTRYLNAFLRTSMGCISYRNIHTSIGIHFGHDAMDPARMAIKSFVNLFIDLLHFSERSQPDLAGAEQSISIPNVFKRRGGTFSNKIW